MRWSVVLGMFSSKHQHTVKMVQAKWPNKWQTAQDKWRQKSGQEQKRKEKEQACVFVSSNNKMKMEKKKYCIMD